MGECARRDLSLTSGDLAEMLDRGVPKASGAGNATSQFRTRPPTPESKTTYPSRPRGAHGPCHAACASAVGPLGALRRPLRRPVEISAAPGPLASCLSDEETWRRRRRLLGLGPAEGDGQRQRWRLGADGAAGRGPVTFCCSCGRAS